MKKNNQQNQNLLKVVISEVRDRSLGTTQQILDVHKVKSLDDPANVHIDYESNENYKVYLALEDSSYSFVMSVDEKNDQLKLISSYVEAYSRVYLCVYSDKLFPNEISKRIGLEPTRTIIKDEALSPTAIKAKEHRWYYEPQKDLPYSLEKKLNFLLENLNPMSKKIFSLSGETSNCLHIMYDGYTEWMGGWHFNRDTIAKIAALNVEIDFDLYASGPNLPQ